MRRTPVILIQSAAALSLVLWSGPGHGQEARRDLKERSDCASVELSLRVGDPVSAADKRRCGFDGPADSPASQSRPPSSPSSPSGFGADDKYSTVEAQKLMLGGPQAQGLSSRQVQSVYDGMDMPILEFHRRDINDPWVKQWCQSAVDNRQHRRDELDNKGEAIQTVEAYTKACADIYTHRLTLTASCKNVKQDKKEKKKKKNKPKRSCTVNAKMVVGHYVPQLQAGRLGGFVRDRKWGRGGSVTLMASASSTKTVGKKGAGVADQKAKSAAASQLGIVLSRKLKDIEAFQSRAPVVYAGDGVAKICLSRWEVTLDTPFNVVVNMEGRKTQKGFVKARTLRDGCVAAIAQKKRRGGERANDGPLDAQVILGGDDVMAGMTAWEMPSMHVNFGVGLGIVPGLDKDTGPALALMQEYNFGRLIGISELHEFMTLRLGVMPAEKVYAKYAEAYPISWGQYQPGELADNVLMVRGSLGALKRWYNGPVFAELGAGLVVSYYLIDSYELEDETAVELGMVGLSATGLAGLGLQLSPRVIVKASGGLHYGMARPVLQVDEETI
ncbi:MAG: hypothetical protein VX938_05590, partial [Myxococcota bacterium]|nr:hypothetical protein [Myxococcota bacterium]